MRVGIVTLGCDKNTVDGEYLAGLLDAGGVAVRAVGASLDDALLEAPELDAVIIATCGFTDAARTENIDCILAWAEAKRINNPALRLYLSGCLSQRYADELLESIPEIDGLVGVGQWVRLAQAITRDAPARERPRPGRRHATVDLRQSLPRRALDDRPYAYLKIADGCDHRCAFCSIPLMKGRLRSAPRPVVLDEARRLIDRGAREINIIAQDTAQYGRDRYQRLRLTGLLESLLELDGDFRLRLMYCYPAGVTADLIELMAQHPKFCRYLDLPLQHLDPSVLRAMRRPHRTLRIERLIDRLRERVPGIALRTSLIVGFPGETPQAFKNLLDGVRRLRFDWLGAFQYSPEEDTPAAKFPRQTGRAVKQRRYDQLMTAQAQIAAELSQARVGQTAEVLIEGQAEEEDANAKGGEAADHLYVGRSDREAPEVDGLIFLRTNRPLKIGARLPAKITAATTYDLFAKPCRPASA